MKKAYSLIFIVCLLGIAYYYDYWTILHYRPQSIHHWRQTDCASIALNFYQHGMNFFKPEVMFQISDGGTSGYTVGECPLLYYFIAILWKVFGYSDFIYRLANTSIFFIGLFAFHRLLLRITKDAFWSICLPLTLFVSPVVAYYANNYLTDTTSLALILIGWNFFFDYYQQKNNRAFYVAIFFFTIAGLIKVSSLISVMALIGVFVFKTLNIRSGAISEQFKLNIKRTLAFATLFAFVIGWNVFSAYYNKLHRAHTEDGTPYFSGQTYPIWSLKKESIIDILKEVKNYWLPQYYNISMMVFWSLLAIALLVWFRRVSVFFRTITLLIFLGIVMFSLLWFYAFGQHDYYIINLLILPVFILLSLLDYLFVYQQKLMNLMVLKVAFTLFIIFNVEYAAEKLKERYFGWQNEYPAYKDIHTITPYLREIGIKPEDKVICLPDGATCYTLYLMNQPGWSGTNFKNDSMQVKKYMKLGAKYLILSDAEPLSRACLQPFMKNKIGEYGAATVYKLQ